MPILSWNEYFLNESNNDTFDIEISQEFDYDSDGNFNGTVTINGVEIDDTYEEGTIMLAHLEKETGIDADDLMDKFEEIADFSILRAETATIKGIKGDVNSLEVLAEEID